MVTSSTPGCRNKSYAQADPCSPAPSTSMRIAQPPPHEPRENERRKARRSRQATVARVRFACDDSGRPHPRAARASGARAVHRAGLSRNHHATDREEGRRGGGHDLPPFHEQATLLQRAVSLGGTLGGTARQGRRRAKVGPREKLAEL